MERSLCLVLNGRQSNKMPLRDTIFLTLETMEAKDLDKYISKTFDSSAEVRTKYASKIEPFLEQHKDLIERVERETGKKFSGSIVITELGEDLMLERKKVIYKKDMVLFRQITKNKKFLLAWEARDYLNYRSAIDNNKIYHRVFADYFARELRFYCVSEGKFKRVSGQWRNAIKSAYYYYDIIRQGLKEYKERYQDLELDSLDVIYSQYQETLVQKGKSEKTVQVEEELQDLEAIKIDDRLSKDLLMHMADYEEPERFKTYVDEDGYPGDLEPLNTDVIRDDENLESGIERGKTKTLHNNNYRLFDYEN